MILMLEDDPERLTRFAATLQQLNPSMPLRVWRDAHAMIREIDQFLQETVLIALDHDLEPEPDGTDPGDGLMVVKHLVAQPVIRPVVIHSSNGVRASWMAGEFDLAGWRHWRVPPIGDDWIEFDWRRTVARLLRRSQTQRDGV